MPHKDTGQEKVKGCVNKLCLTDCFIKCSFHSQDKNHLLKRAGYSTKTLLGSHQCYSALNSNVLHK